MNGRDLTRDVTRKNVMDMMKDTLTVTMEVQYNPEGYAMYDAGEELKRIDAISPKPPQAASHHVPDNSSSGRNSIHATSTSNAENGIVGAPITL